MPRTDGSPGSPFWLTAFLDYPASTFAAATSFWSRVTSYAVSPPRGASGEFATLVPPDGDDYLRVQRVGDGGARPGPRIHLDLHVADVEAAAVRATGLGAARVASAWDDVPVLTSPGGLTLCFVTHPARVPPRATIWSPGRRSQVYQVCLDVPAGAYDAEVGFWTSLLDVRLDPITGRPEFAWLRRRGGGAHGDWALGVLTQRRDDDDGPVRAHLDLGSTDRASEVAHHVACGALLETVEEFWTVLRDPAGLAYCVTDRDPETGMLVSDAAPRVAP